MGRSCVILNFGKMKNVRRINLSISLIHKGKLRNAKVYLVLKVLNISPKMYSMYCILSVIEE